MENNSTFTRSMAAYILAKTGMENDGETSARALLESVGFTENEIKAAIMAATV